MERLVINLHSTMLLLYLNLHPLFHLQKHYLHSTMLLLYLAIMIHDFYSTLIYIPLCFYFILFLRG